MPSRPPDTTFYFDEDNYTLWRTLSRIFEDFQGENEKEWPERKERFKLVLKDIESRLETAA